MVAATRHRVPRKWRGETAWFRRAPYEYAGCRTLAWRGSAGEQHAIAHARAHTLRKLTREGARGRGAEGATVRDLCKAHSHASDSPLERFGCRVSLGRRLLALLFESGFPGSRGALARAVEGLPTLTTHTPAVGSVYLATRNRDRVSQNQSRDDSHEQNRKSLRELSCLLVCTPQSCSTSNHTCGTRAETSGFAVGTTAPSTADPAVVEPAAVHARGHGFSFACPRQCFTLPLGE